MTKDLLERYPDICGELADLHRRHEISDRTKELMAQKHEIDSFINSLPWRKRSLVQYVLQYGPKWDIIRREMGGLKSAEATRKEYERIFEKF